MKKILITILLLIPITVHASYDYTINSFKMNNISIPKYKGNVCTNINKTFFTKKELENKYSYIKYYGEDNLGRTLKIESTITMETLPTEKREEVVDTINPTGWVQASYKEIINTNYLYNRAHLMAWQLGGSYRKSNLITATNNLNKYGMLPIENTIKKYILENKKIIYRVTPYYYKNNLLSYGVLIEAKSLNDNNINITKFCYNVEPGISIDYKTGKSKTTLDDLKIKEVKLKNNKIVISWNNNNADSYEVSYRRLGPSKYTTYNTKNNNYTINNIIKNKTYQIKIRSVKKLYNNNIYSRYSKV